MGGTHIGAKTNHQDQLMYAVNLSTIKATVNKPQNPIPCIFISLLLCARCGVIVISFLHRIH